MKVLDKIFLLLVFLHLSETFRILLFLLEQPSQIFSIVSLILFLIYLSLNLKILKILFKKKIFKYWLTLIFTIPTTTFLINFLRGFIELENFIYWISFNLAFSCLFVVTTIVAYKVDLKYLKIIFWCSIISTIIGSILFFLTPALFIKIGELSGSKLASVVHGSEDFRNRSFFSHPNGAAFSIICFFIFLFSTTYKSPKPVLYYMFCSLLLFLMVIITGSRTSIILTICILLLYIRPMLFRIIKIKYSSNGKFIKIGLALTLVFVALISSQIFITVIELIDSKGLNKVLERFSFLSSFFDTTDKVEDASFNFRANILNVYLNYIEKNFLFGYGPEFRDEKIAINEFTNVSQNAYIEGALVYGIIYPIYFIYIIIKTFLYTKERYNINRYLFNPLRVLMVVIFLISFSINDIFWNRAVVILLGVLIGLEIRSKSVNIN
jgi:hypothetical protein